MSKVQASDRIYRRLDDLQASLGDVMTRINRLEEAVRTIVDVAQGHNEAIASLHKRIEALERNDG